MKTNIIKIFLVDSDPEWGRKICYFLEQNPVYHVVRFSNGFSALEKIKSYPALVLTSNELPDINGFEMIRKIKADIPDMPVIFLSDQKEIEVALELLNQGAENYIIKNDNCITKLITIIKKLVDNDKVFIKDKDDEISEDEIMRLIKGKSESLQKVFRLIDKASKTKINISIYGETGTGKELVATVIHRKSFFNKGPFVVVNCNTLIKELAESELFGHEKGAFTGATGERKGKFEEADQGTIFLDEIGDLDINLQARLLRVLQEQEITRIGSNKPIKINVRTIIASTKNLKDEVKNKNFREDLYYRLMGLPIYLPPLRERGQDIIMLANYFLGEYIKKNKSEPVEITESAMQELLSYQWLGNVRELKNTIERSAMMSENNKITNRSLTFDNTSTQGGIVLLEELSMDEYKQRILHQFLNKYKNPDVAADKLGIGRATVFRMMKKGRL